MLNLKNKHKMYCYRWQIKIVHLHMLPQNILMKQSKRKNRKTWYKSGKQIYNINGPEILISSKRYQVGWIGPILWSFGNCTLNFTTESLSFVCYIYQCLRKVCLIISQGFWKGYVPIFQKHKTIPVLNMLDST